MDIGIYKLYWSTCPYFYIGGSIDLKRRRYQHHNKLKRGVHENRNVQRVYSEHGLPEFEILEFCEEHEKYDREKFHLQQSEGDPYCANLWFDPLGKGRTLSEEARISVGIAARARVITEEQRQRWRESNKNRIITPETREKLSIAGKGRVHSQETKDKISKANKGRILSEETRKNIGEAKRGKTLSQYHRNKISQSRIGELNHSSRKVINTETLEVYICAQDLYDSGAIQIGYSNLVSMLNGTIKTNYTPYEYLDVYEANGNKKRDLYVKSNTNAKKVINTKTGEVYNSAKEVVTKGLVQLQYKTFMSQLNGQIKTNKTPFMYLENYENQNEQYGNITATTEQSSREVQHSK